MTISSYSNNKIDQQGGQLLNNIGFTKKLNTADKITKIE